MLFVCVQGLSAVSGLTTLTNLEFSQVNAETESAKVAFSCLAACTQLRHLTLECWHFTPATLEGRKDLSGMMCLTQSTALTRVRLDSMEAEQGLDVVSFDLG